MKQYHHRRRQKNFQRGPIKIEAVLTTKNGRVFEIWEVRMKVCENPGGAMTPLCPPC